MDNFELWELMVIWSGTKTRGESRHAADKIEEAIDDMVASAVSERVKLLQADNNALWAAVTRFIEMGYARGNPKPNPLHPYATVPKDGRLVRLSTASCGPHDMRWHAKAVNEFAGGRRGIWKTDDGPMSWSDFNPAWAPTHWQEVA